MLLIRCGFIIQVADVFRVDLLWSNGIFIHMIGHSHFSTRTRVRPVRVVVVIIRLIGASGIRASKLTLGSLLCFLLSYCAFEVLLVVF